MCDVYVLCIILMYNICNFEDFFQAKSQPSLQNNSTENRIHTVLEHNLPDMPHIVILSIIAQSLQCHMHKLSEVTTITLNQYFFIYEVSTTFYLPMITFKL